MILKQVDKPTIFLHGMMGDSSDFDGLKKYIHFAHEVTPNLPFHKEDSSFETLEEFARDFKDKFLSHKKTMIGYSLGGRIALLIAFFYPELIEKIVLISAHPGIPLNHEIERTQRLLWDQSILKNIKTKEEFSIWLDDWYSMKMWGQLNQNACYQEMKLKRLNNNIALIKKAFSFFSPGIFPDTKSVLDNKKISFLSLSGELDFKYSNLVSSLKDKSNVSTHIIKNAGHNLLLESPKELASLISTFI